MYTGRGSSLSEEVVRSCFMTRADLKQRFPDFSESSSDLHLALTAQAGYDPLHGTQN